MGGIFGAPPSNFTRPLIVAASATAAGAAAEVAAVEVAPVSAVCTAPSSSPWSFSSTTSFPPPQATANTTTNANNRLRYFRRDIVSPLTTQLTGLYGHRRDGWWLLLRHGRLGGGAGVAHLIDADGPDVVAQVVRERDGVAHGLAQRFVALEVRTQRGLVRRERRRVDRAGQRRAEAASLGIAREVRGHARVRNHLARAADPVGDPFVTQAQFRPRKVRGERGRVGGGRHRGVRGVHR